MKKSWFVIAAAVPLVVVGSIGVWQLSGGDQRRLGTLEPLKEPLPLAWRGAWSAEQGYAAGEVVAYDGLAYVAERRNEGSSPAPAQCGEDCPWTAMGSKGPKGDAGPPGGISGDEIIKNTKNVQAGYTEMSTQCPSGKRVLGGGVFATGGAVIAGSMPVDGGWLAGIINNTGAAPGVSVHAVCANAGGISGYEIIKNTKNVQAGYTEMSTQCPSGKRVLGGGVFATGGAVIAGSMPVDGGWLAGIVNNTGAAPGVSVHAVCANAT